MKLNTPIVVVAYNRERSLARLLKSLEKANYPHTDIELIISIDFAIDNDNVLKMANNFSWHQGKKTVIYHEKNLGLRKHIIKCGDLSEQYGSVIILEDDLFVSPNFYNYTINALEFCKNDNEIGGISLYNHQLNVHTMKNFSPFEDGFDNWYFQFASSWGQAWSSNQWKGFMKWYEQKHNLDDDTAIPTYVRRWSEKSWLKYNIAYLISNNKFFFYPKISLSTNFSDAGTHIGNDSTRYQVPVLAAEKKDYKFSKLEESNSVYDAFYENKLLPKLMGLKNENTTIDLYGYKEINTQYLLTSKILNFKIIKAYAKSLKPIDANILCEVTGNELFLYDTEKKVNNDNKENAIRAIVYNHKHIKPKTALRIVRNYCLHLLQKILSIFRIK